MALEAAHNQDILIIADFNGAELIKYDQVVSTQGEAELPESFKFFQNYPNPFNSETNVSFRVQEPGHATLEIVDILGRRVVRLLDAQVGVGTHNILWNAKDVDGKEVASGVYFVTLSFNERRITRKMIFLK
jgi:hypothetical protein